ncbi:GtrA family protein [Eubacteriales bacterium OttesenSCG-928-N14]|nr:GtrA family protein [Eubacteriales bacterium OttesenSCG-928-N14]
MAEKQPSFWQRHPELFKMLKFTFASGFSTIVELIIYYVLQGVVFASLNTTPFKFWIFEYDGIGYMWAFLISTTIGYAIAFVLNRKVTFHADANPTLSIVLYIIMVLFTIVVTTWMGTALMHWFISIGKRSLGEAIAKPIVALVAVLWTYPLNRFVIHRNKKEVAEKKAE